MKYNILPTILLAGLAVAATSEESTVDPVLESLLSAPTWVVNAINSAEPTAWASSYEYDLAFAESVGLAMAEGTMPAWYSKLPESVREFESTRAAAIVSYELTHSAAQVHTATATATAATTAATNTATSTTASSNTVSSVSNNGVLMAVAGAAGIIGLGF